VTETTEDDLDAVLAELEPVMARTRRLMSGIWLDRTLSKTNLFVLMLLDGHGPVSMSRLAGLLGASLPNATGIVTRMEELGYVERIRDERDRRVVLVRSTAKGREIVQELEALRRQHLQRLVGELAPQDRARCLKAFRALREAGERLDARDARAGAPQASSPAAGAPQTPRSPQSPARPWPATRH
jgi:DNA-binding MarR family transcriptional regulator